MLFDIDWLTYVLCSTKHIIGYIGDDFYRSYLQTKSVKALKKPVGLEHKFESYKDYSSVLQ